jgi:hypothetical protein
MYQRFWKLSTAGAGTREVRERRVGCCMGLLFVLEYRDFLVVGKGLEGRRSEGWVARECVVVNAVQLPLPLRGFPLGEGDLVTKL